MGHRYRMISPLYRHPYSHVRRPQSSLLARSFDSVRQMVPYPTTYRLQTRLSIAYLHSLPFPLLPLHLPSSLEAKGHPWLRQITREPDLEHRHQHKARASRMYPLNSDLGLRSKTCLNGTVIVGRRARVKSSTRTIVDKHIHTCLVYSC
jgi:hypothetical protein